MRRRTLLFVVFSFCVLLLLLIAGIASITKTSSISQLQLLFTPMQSILIRVFQGTASTAEIQTLKEQNVSLQKKLVKMQMLESDNKALRDQFQTTTLSANSLIPVEVIGMPGSLPGITVPDDIIIGAGEKEGVQKGQAVVYKDQLIGTVVSIAPHVAKVQLMSATNVSFAAKTAKTGALGIVKGQGNGQVEFDNVVLSDTLSVGDMVVTGPNEGETGKGIPPGLVIGEITSVDKKSSNLFQQAHIQVLTDVTRLSEIFLFVSQ
ncbi:MAG: rod shape-determining protein MreC [Patescibacteria group bacterium]|nr:rod shape-determining protein MreC [Patescibacteria group bacterium]